LGKPQVADIRRAYLFARKAHAGQRRLTGEEYINHPLAVSLRIAQWRLDAVSVKAALLHDTLEDSGTSSSEIIKLFGQDVARIVSGVTNVTAVRLVGSTDDLFEENLRKMILVMARDLRVVFVKLADRLHNMQTLYALSRKRQTENARETLEIYAPLAERLGMGEVKGELEDLAFQYLYEGEYRDLLKSSSKYYKNTGENLGNMRSSILAELEKYGVEASIHSRRKHYYSLWRKLQRKEIAGDIERVHDITALRILVPSVRECYLALGAVHGIYRPVPKIGVSDFIAQPKPNGYRSIHTKVFGEGGKITEIQIRTYRMHEEAEHGAAAHWAYARQKSSGVNDEVLDKEGAVVSHKMEWVRSLVHWQEELRETGELLESVKVDMFNHRNFVFSPKGDVYDLPRGATPVDFACAVHTRLCRYIKGAKVNGKLVPLSFELTSGDVVEIIKNRTERPPSRDWLNFVVTATARKAIKKGV